MQGDLPAGAVAHRRVAAQPALRGDGRELRQPLALRPAAILTPFGAGLGAFAWAAGAHSARPPDYLPT